MNLFLEFVLDLYWICIGLDLYWIGFVLDCIISCFLISGASLILAPLYLNTTRALAEFN